VIAVSPNSSIAGDLLPGPGIFRFSFDLADRDATYWLSAQPIDGQTLDDFLQQLIAGVTNLPPDMVRPRWQPEAPPIPDFGVDWIAQSIVRQDPYGNGYPFEGFGTDGQVYLDEHEDIELFTSCYGTHADWYSRLIRGLQVSQNREVLFLAGMGLIEVRGGIVAPEFINNRWWRRVDRTVRIRREVRRAYPILSILEALGQITGEQDP
jgi:hypothetical protein